MTSEAEAFWKDWIEGERSVANLRLHVVPLLEHMRVASQREDWEQVQRLMDSYSHVSGYCADEPLLTTYEWGMMRVNLELADDMCIRGQLERAMDHVSYVKEALRVGDKRRAEHAMSPRPNSELRFSILGVQATCLLEDAGYFDSQPEVETALIAAEFWRAADNAVTYLRANRSDDDEHVRVVMHVLSRFELEICKLCWRYNESFAEVALDLFNQRTGNQLEPTLRHFERLDSLESRSGWYWDFELSKLESAGDYSREEVQLCARNRSLAARLSVGAGPLPIMEQLWSRQVQRLLDNLEQT